MKKLLVFCALLAGCVSKQTVKDTFYPMWINRNFDDFVVQYGAPSSDYKLQSGSTLYKWASVSTLYKPVTTSGTIRDTTKETKNYTSYTSGGEREMVCEMNILVDKQNTIQSITITKDTAGEWAISRCSEVLNIN